MKLFILGLLLVSCSDIPTREGLHDNSNCMQIVSDPYVILYECKTSIGTCVVSQNAGIFCLKESK